MGKRLFPTVSCSRGLVPPRGPSLHGTGDDRLACFTPDAGSDRRGIQGTKGTEFLVRHSDDGSHPCTFAHRIPPPLGSKGYWATAVATNLMAEVPLIGTALQKIVVGGSEYGHYTLTRFFALHAGVLPATLVGLVFVHIYLFRKHGIHVKEPRPKRDSYFWPDQVLKDAVACLAVLLAVVGLTIYFRGAPLGPPADPSNEFPARPEWYFYFLSTP